MTILSNEQNEAINLFIYDLRNNPDEQTTWETISDIINDRFDVELSGNACRKRFERTVDRIREEKENSKLELLDERVVALDSANSDVIELLRERFGISQEYQPKRIKTTATNDKTWYGAEWVREEVNEDNLELILEQIKAHAPVYHEFTPLKQTDGHLLVPILYDAHIDKAVFNGGKTYTQIVDEMIETALGLGLNISRIMFVIGNDFGNTDNVHGNTTAGTPQENTVHWARGIDLRCQYAIEAVERFASVASTDVIMVHGNHDRYSNQWLGKVLEAQFHNNKRVTVNNNASPRKYYSWEANMWGFTHGNEENVSMLPAIMATEAPVQYAFASYREVFTGHFHRKQSAFYPLTEAQGLTIRWMPALSGTDDWHNLKGYVGARRAGLGIIYAPDGYKMEYSVSV